MITESEMKKRSNLPRSAICAPRRTTGQLALLAAAPSWRQPAEWLPVPSQNRPRCIWRLVSGMLGASLMERAAKAYSLDLIHTRHGRECGHPRLATSKKDVDARIRGHDGCCGPSWRDGDVPLTHEGPPFFDFRRHLFGEEVGRAAGR